MAEFLSLTLQTTDTPKQSRTSHTSCVCVWVNLSMFHAGEHLHKTLPVLLDSLFIPRILSCAHLECWNLNMESHVGIWSPSCVAMGYLFENRGVTFHSESEILLNGWCGEETKHVSHLCSKRLDHLATTPSHEMFVRAAFVTLEVAFSVRRTPRCRKPRSTERSRKGSCPKHTCHRPWGRGWKHLHKSQFCLHLFARSQHQHL